MLRPYLLRRLKRDVEKELPSKFEHLVLCPLSKRQRFLYDEFMSRAQTRSDLSSGVYQKIANILMQLRKVCNHPDLFEVRPIVTSFAIDRSAIADFEIKELLVRRRLLQEDPAETVNLDVLGLDFRAIQNTSMITAASIRQLDGTSLLHAFCEPPGEAPPYDVRTIDGFKKHRQYQDRVYKVARWAHVAYLNQLRCSYTPIISNELITTARKLTAPHTIASSIGRQYSLLDDTEAIRRAVRTYRERADDMASVIERFAFATPPVIARDLPQHALSGIAEHLSTLTYDPSFDASLHHASVKLQIAFPDRSLLQYDCGKLQRLAELLRERKLNDHRVLIFTQMTRILDLLEQFLTFHGYLYLRLDGGTRIEDRQYITERFNSDNRIFCFIASSRSGGLGIKYAASPFI